jgi:hypothetical protein
MQPIDWANDSEFLDSKLTSLKGVTLYLLSTGRNAWHSTWSERYRRDAALFSTFDSAKSSAEKARNRGTQFEIQQHPGLAFYSVKGVVALVEFHSKYSFGKLKIEEIGDRLKLGTLIRDAVSPFVAATDEFWTTPFPSESSFTDVKADLAEEFEPLPNPSYLKKWNSVSSGSNYYLGWHEKSKPEETPISRVLKEFKIQNRFTDVEKLESEMENARQVAIEKRKREQEERIQLKKASIQLSSLLAEFTSQNNEKDKE